MQWLYEWWAKQVSLVVLPKILLQVKSKSGKTEAEHLQTIMHPEGVRPDLPVGNYTRVVTLLVLIHLHITHEHKRSVEPICTDHASASDRLGKMRVYRGSTDRLQSL